MAKAKNTLQINTGVVSLAIERDGENVGSLDFNPNDTLFVERYYEMLQQFQAKKEEADAALEAIEENAKTDVLGVPDNMADNIAMEKELCDFTEKQIDDVFGEGTTKKVFGEIRNMEIFIQFFEGIMPYFEKVRSSKIEKYTAKPVSKKRKQKRK